MSRTYVAIDLETTGVDAAADAIIEIGAVRFTRDRVLDRFSTLVNPRRRLPDAVQALTGIHAAALAAAPPLETVAGDLEAFLGDDVLVGHNAMQFDVPVLDRAGIRHGAEVYDTQDLAALLLPGLSQYGLAPLMEHFEIDFPVRHRALPDAEAARELLLRLFALAAEFPADTLAQVAQWLTPTFWPWRTFFREAWELAPVRPPTPLSAQTNGHRPPAPLKAARNPVPIPCEEPLAVLASAGTRPDVLADFDERVEQQAMVTAVGDAFNRGARLMVEAGTGTGKSLAYLIPAACQALANESRVVVSTSTINLQEQLTGKDIPAMRKLLPSGETLQSCQLKGRRNYLCLNRFAALRATPALSDDEALLASRVLLWLARTQTGDRAELRMTQGEDAMWARISADGAACTNDSSPFMVDGSCFLQRARKAAESAHVVVVNHALLLSDMAIRLAQLANNTEGVTGPEQPSGSVLPPYEHLIVDEAHHLEDEATRQFGFSCRGGDIENLLESCGRLPAAVQAALRAAPVDPATTSNLQELARALRRAATAAGDPVRAFGDQLSGFLQEHAGGRDQERLHVTSGVRAQPGWSTLEISWENARLALSDVGTRLGKLLGGLRADELRLLNRELLVSDALMFLDDVRRVGEGLSKGIEKEDAQRVVWLERDRSEGGATLAWAPLTVSDLLRDGLFADRRTVILTGATLRAAGDFSYLQERLGLPECETLAVGSPFDYRRCALAVVPRDMPEPSSPLYLNALSQAVIDLACAAKGRTLVLFTSHASLRAVHGIAAGVLKDEGIAALAQGIDGSPRQLVRALQANPQTVILGTASFWEGVDIPGDALSLLVMPRLPFAVPTDPIFAARSAVYEDSFNEYALPQAVLRFKQGFGRLIRTKTDRGVVVVLDQRIVARTYGKMFLEALPGCPIRTAPLRDMPQLVEQWLAARPAAGAAIA